MVQKYHRFFPHISTDGPMHVSPRYCSASRHDSLVRVAPSSSGTPCGPDTYSYLGLLIRINLPWVPMSRVDLSGCGCVVVKAGLGTRRHCPQLAQQRLRSQIGDVGNASHVVVPTRESFDELGFEPRSQPCKECARPLHHPSSSHCDNLASCGGLRTTSLPPHAGEWIEGFVADLQL